MRAYPVTQAEQPRLYAIVSELAGRARMPMPRLYMSPTNQPNAFATGTQPPERGGLLHRGDHAHDG